MNDLIGNKLNTDDVIAYATRTGNSGALHIGYIYEITKDDCAKVYVLESEWSDRDYKKLGKAKLIYEDRIVRLDKSSIPVQELLKKWSHFWQKH